MIKNSKIKKWFERTIMHKKQNAFNMTWEQIPSALLMKGAEKFIDRIYELIMNETRICVVGDYDADGVFSTSTLVRCLRLAAKLLGKTAKITYQIPHRFEDGYGLSKKVIDKVIAKNPKVQTIITCDNGIVAFDAVQYAKMKGIEVIITDHHKAKEDGTLPDTDIIVNPNRLDDDYPFKGISGTIVVYKLFLEFAKRYFPENYEDFQSFVDLAGVSVISDVMPVTYENRVYLKETLKIFNNEGLFKRRFAWTAIIEALRHSGKLSKESIINEKDLGFSFSPMINAQSRVYGIADLGIDLFLSTNTTDVREKVAFLVETNEERKRVSNEAFLEAEQVDFGDKALIVYRNDNLGDGYIGLVAGKLAERLNRPTIVLTMNHGVLKGSARTAQGVDLFSILSKASHLAEKIGGHEGAAGMSIKEENFAEFEEILQKEFNKALPKNRNSRIKPDFKLKPEELTRGFLDELYSLRPFGEGFQLPKVQIDGIEASEVKLMGKVPTKGGLKPHIKYRTKSGFDVVAMNGTSSLPTELDEGQTFSIIGEPELNLFLGVTTVQVSINPNNFMLE